MPELEHFAGHDFIQPMDAGDSVTERDDGAHLVHGNLGFVIFNLIADELCYFVCLYLSHKSCFSLELVVAEVLRLAALTRSPVPAAIAEVGLALIRHKSCCPHAPKLRPASSHPLNT